MNESKSHCLPAIAFFLSSPPPPNCPEQQTASRGKKKNTPNWQKRRRKANYHIDFPPVSLCSRTSLSPLRYTSASRLSRQTWLAQQNKYVDTLFQQMRNDTCINHSCSGERRGLLRVDAVAWLEFGRRYTLMKISHQKKTKRERVFFFLSQIKGRQLLLYIPWWAATLQTGSWYSAMQAPCLIMFVVCVVMPSLIKMTPGWMYCSLCDQSFTLRICSVNIIHYYYVFWSLAGPWVFELVILCQLYVEVGLFQWV